MRRTMERKLSTLGSKAGTKMDVVFSFLVATTISSWVATCLVANDLKGEKVSLVIINTIFVVYFVVCLKKLQYPNLNQDDEEIATTWPRRKAVLKESVKKLAYVIFSILDNECNLLLHLHLLLYSCWIGVLGDS
ncbi:unnamed protein product [Microthlaspi erraticum]|uniref:Uncharacterized protein n=1 Tax=Microthlaspi erraticum TaxID=1685480 RepID=A0A6D2K3I2_9BRAS|nr:unnamed protein product [Microthlaspi erraticum]